MFLDTQHPLHVGDTIWFQFTLPGEGQTSIAGRAQVVWIEPLVGVGVKFTELRDEQREQIRFWVAGVFFGQE